MIPQYHMSLSILYRHHLMNICSLLIILLAILYVSDPYSRVKYSQFGLRCNFFWLPQFNKTGWPDQLHFSLPFLPERIFFSFGKMQFPFYMGGSNPGLYWCRRKKNISTSENWTHTTVFVSKLNNYEPMQFLFLIRG